MRSPVAATRAMSQSALIVVVPEAEPWVEDLRARHDPTARVGIPAHITLITPFLSPESIGDRERDTLAAVFRDIKAFTFSLMRVGRFPQTVYLAPEPETAFIEMIAAVVQAFPSYPPYGGRFSDVIPHLTVSDKDPDAAAVVESELRSRMAARGPIQAVCNRVQLYEEAAGYWMHVESFSLAQSGK